MAKVELSDGIRRNFHLFWDNFPAPVMLVYKDRTILDRNPAAEAIAGCAAGGRCCDLGEKSAHERCLANHALREQAGKRSVDYIPHMGMVIDSYWIPLAGREDIYIHFGNDITAYAAERLFPRRAEKG